MGSSNKELEAKRTAYFSKQKSLISDRNIFYKAYDPKAPQRSASFEEQMRLAGYGYTGVFGRSSNPQKQTLGLVGEDWQRAYALNRLRQNKEMLAFSLIGDQDITLKEIQDNPSIKDYVAADILVPGSKRYTAYTNLYNKFVDKYGLGGEKYVSQEGHMPKFGSTYGFLFNTNVKKVRKDDVTATYQQSLAKEVMRVGKGLVEYGEANGDVATRELGYGYIRLHEKDLIPTSRTKPKAAEIKALEATLKGYQVYSAEVAAEISGKAEPVSSYDRVAAGAIGSVGLDPLTKAASKAIDYMNGIAESDFLAPRDTFWNPLTKDVPLYQRGILGFMANFARGGARMGTAAPAGIGMILDEAYFATKETVNWATNDNYDWGDKVDFEMGDALWASLAANYYDPFAKDAEGKDRSYWEGLTKDTAGSFNRLGDQINKDPFAYALDALSVVPVVGWAAKAASIPMTVGKLGVRAADRAAHNRTSAATRAGWKAQRGVMSKDEYATFGMAEVTRTREAAQIARFKGEMTGKKDTKVVDAAEQLALAAKFEFAPSGRTWRKTTRNAWNNPDGKSAQELSRWKALGYEFDGLDTGFGVRSAARFEHRTKVMDKPSKHVAANPRAIVRMPASPIMRGIKEGFFWVGRGLDDVTDKLSKADTYTGKVATKLLDFPLFSYSYNYTKAVRKNINSEWGDVNREFQRAATILEIDNEADLTPSMRAAIQMNWVSGGDDIPTNTPSIRRRHIEDQIDAYKEFYDPTTGKYSPTAAGDVALLQLKLKDLKNNDIEGLEAQAKSFDDSSNSDFADIRGRIADATYKADDVHLDNAMDLVRRLEEQNNRMSTRFAHDGTTAANLEHLKLLYTEPIQGLRLTVARLFGDKDSPGELSDATGKVLAVKDTLLLVDIGRAAKLDRAGILDLAQHPYKTGNVFQDITDAVTRTRLENQMVDAFDALGTRRGVFTGSIGGYGTPPRPVLIQADIKVPAGFVAFRMPTLRLTKSEDGRVTRGSIIDPEEVFILPKVFFDAEDSGKGRVILESAKDGREALYVGSLNAMADIFPKARFYSEKFDDSGLQGTRMNEQQLANQHTVAESGLRLHALKRIIISQANHYKNRVERDLRSMVDSETIVMNASDVVGKTSKESGVRVLNNVGVHTSYEAALENARVRRVDVEFVAKMKPYQDGDKNASKLDVQTGMGVRNVNGEDHFFVRGDYHDWVLESSRDDLVAHSAMQDWMKNGFVDMNDIPADGKVLAISNNTYNKLVETLLDSDELSHRILQGTAVKGFGSIFKFMVLNANPAFITTNVIGGLAMMMMYNPAAAPRILASTIQSIARKSIEKGTNNDRFTHQLTTFKNDSDAISRVQAYENTHNIYRQDAGLMGVLDKNGWKKKYIWHGGYTVVSAWEEMMRRNIGMDFVRNDAGFQSFMRGPEVAAYIERNVDWHGNPRGAGERITAFEAATDLLLDNASPYYDANLLHSMRYVTNTVSGNYHQFNPMERAMRDVVMPFYAWQRHSATFSYRMLVDKPITTNAMYEFGAQGYQQNSEQGLPDWMMGTMPVPAVIKDMFDIKDEDFRIDGSTLSPFGVTGQMGMAAIKLLTGAPSKENFFSFINPFFQALLEDTLGVDIKTGNVNWERQAAGDGASGGLLGQAKDVGYSMFRATTPYKLSELAKYSEYEQDSIQNKYSAIENAPDILSNLDPDNPDKVWKLKIPNMTTNEAQNTSQRALSATGIKTFRLNPDMLPLSARVDAVGAIALKHLAAGERADLSKRALNSSEEWKRKYAYVHELWAPYQRRQGVPESKILMVLAKIESERPKSGAARELTKGVGGL